MWSSPQKTRKQSPQKTRKQSPQKDTKEESTKRRKKTRKKSPQKGTKEESAKGTERHKGKSQPSGEVRAWLPKKKKEKKRSVACGCRGRRRTQDKERGRRGVAGMVGLGCFWSCLVWSVAAAAARQAGRFAVWRGLLLLMVVFVVGFAEWRGRRSGRRPLKGEEVVCCLRRGWRFRGGGRSRSGRRGRWRSRRGGRVRRPPGRPCGWS